MAELKDSEEVRYTVVTPNDEPALAVIRKTGQYSEFTLADIEADMQLYAKKKTELEGLARVEEAKLANIDRTNPEIGQMSEELRQVIYIYAKAFSTAKVARQQIAQIQEQEKLLRGELMQIAVETGLGMKMADKFNTENDGEKGTDGGAEGGTQSEGSGS